MDSSRPGPKQASWPPAQPQARAELPTNGTCHLPDKGFQALANFFFKYAATCAGTKAETSPPIAAIWRTNVAVIGRTAGDGGRKTVCTLGAMVPFIPAICIS